MELLLCSIKCSFEILQCSFKIIIQNHKTRRCSWCHSVNCSDLISYFFSQCFLLTTFIFKTIFDILEPVTCQLQSRNIDMQMAKNILTNVILQIKEHRNDNSFEKVVKIFNEFSEESVVYFLPIISSANTCNKKINYVYCYKTNLNIFKCKIIILRLISD